MAPDHQRASSRRTQYGDAADDVLEGDPPTGAAVAGDRPTRLRGIKIPELGSPKMSRLAPLSTRVAQIRSFADSLVYKLRHSISA